MAIKKIYGNMNVVEAATKRIQNIFANGCKVYLAFSGGKDTLCMCSIVYDLILQGKIDPKQLTVVFIDEEALYQSMFDMAMRWRKRFIAIGAEFRWYCLPVYQISMLHHLADDESWITWEPGKEDVWIRNAPPFAILRDPAVEYVGQMNYQSFLERVCMDGLMIVGVRASESVQRQQYIATVDMSAGNMTKNNHVFPIYDWTDNDVWLYIKEHNLDFPEAYIDLYRAGVKKHQLRLCNFFASESIAGLRWIAEVDPDLWARILRREPNAYLAVLYWDSEMFHRSTAKRKKLEEQEAPKDYRALCKEMLFTHPDQYFTNEKTRNVARRYRQMFIKAYSFMERKHWKRMYEAIQAGDPKLRSLRAMYTDIFTDYLQYARKESGKPAIQEGGEYSGSR